MSQQLIDWKAFKASLSREPYQTPSGFWTTDWQQYSLLCRRIKELKQATERLLEMRPLLLELSRRETCEKHWIQGCYTCGLAVKDGHIDDLIKRSKKALAQKRFAFLLLLVKYGKAKLAQPSPKVTPMPRPKDEIDYGSRYDGKFWDSRSENFATTPTRARDIRDRISLIKAYLKDVE